MEVLIVDDCAISCSVLESMLRDMGYGDVTVVPSASEALAFLRRPGCAVDLILMDVEMPGIDGIEAVRQIKAMHDFRDIPVIMVTVSDKDVSLERAFAAGAVDYLNKPVNEVELRARVGSVLRLKAELDRRGEREKQFHESAQKLAEANRRLQELTRTDELTGIANRRHFEKVFADEWRRAQRNGRPLSLLMIDIDAFKEYNDSYGHLQGDVCIRMTAAALAGTTGRAGDLVARYGGEEFVIVLPDTDLQGAAKVTQEVHERIADLEIPHQASPYGGRLTVSIGVTCAPPGCDGESRAILAAADEALYAAKRGGRNRTVVADAFCGTPV